MIGQPNRVGAGQRGAALLMAIAMTGLLAAVAVEIAGTTLDEILLAEAFRDDFRARWAAQAPLAIVISALQEDKGSFAGFGGKWAGLEEALSVDGLEVRFRVYDESAKVNLNALASSALPRREGTGQALRRMFEALDLHASLVDFLWDWVDADEEPRAAGSEGGYYQSLPRPYAVKNAPFDSLSEIRLIRGFTPEVLRSLGFWDRREPPDLSFSERLTLYSDERINVNTADPLILRSLVDGLPEVFLQDLLDKRNEKPFQRVADLKRLAGMTDALFNKLAPMLSVDSKYFSVVSEATAGRNRKRLMAVLKKESNRVSIVYWRMP